MRILVPLIQDGNGVIQYPGEREKWSNAEPRTNADGVFLVGDYEGSPDFDFEQAPPVKNDSPRHITNLAFDLRFTTEERVAIEMASLDDPAAPLAQRQQAAEVRVSLQRANKAGFTDLDDPVTRTGVEQFELVGLIAPGRSAAILDGPIEERERYT